MNKGTLSQWDPRAGSDADRAAVFAARRSPSGGDHWEMAKLFDPEESTVKAVQVALAVHAPLLLTGEPGTGKTQIASYVARRYGVDRADFRQLDVRSTTSAGDLTYHFDDVNYFRLSRGEGAPAVDKRSCIVEGPLWRAIEARRPSVLLIDEIDKAPRDFPNDLLAVIESLRFRVPELEQSGKEFWVERTKADREKFPPPFVVITSNSERRLPEPFLRRCIVHHIPFNEDTLRRALKAHGERFELDGGTKQLAAEKVWAFRKKDLRKHPATAEFLVWLAALSAHGGITRAHLDVELKKLPLLVALVKDSEDLKRL